jgi:hypothetical protein
MVVVEIVESANGTVGASSAAGKAVTSAGGNVAPVIAGFVGPVPRKDHETTKDDQIATMDYGTIGCSSVGGYDRQRICRQRSFPFFEW